MNLIFNVIVLVSSLNLTSSLWPIEKNSFISINDYNIISTYLSEEEQVTIQLNLTEASLVGIELYDKNGKLRKIWNPQLTDKGIYKTHLSVADIANGTYLLNVIINEESFQQAVFKY